MKAILISLLATVFFCSCNTSNNTTSKKILRLAIQEDPITLDPRKGSDVLSSHLQLILFEGLVGLNPDGSVYPASCSSFSVSSDLKTYTFFLGGTYWSDGTPVTAYDFEKPWKQVLSPSFPSPNAHLFYPIKNAEAVKKGLLPLDAVAIHAKDEHTLVIELENPTPYFLQLITFCSFFPIPSVLEEANPNWALATEKDFICNGPFTLKQWVHQKEIILEKNSLYSKIVSLKLDEMHISVIHSEDTILQLYKNEELDLIGPPFGTLPKDALFSLPEEELLFCPVAATSFITFNTAQFPFSNINLRKALGLAIHRAEITSSLLESGERLALSAVSPNLKGGANTPFYSDNAKEQAKYHLEEALKELNISKEKLEESLVYFYPPTASQISQILQQQWLKTLGLHVKLRCMDPKTLNALLGNKKYAFSQALYRSQYLDPVSVLDRFLHKENMKNYPSWENEEYKQLIQKSYLQTGLTRLRTLEKAEKILLDEMPLSPIFHSSLCFLKKPYVQGVELSPSGGIFFERLYIHK